jgi:hypothetical protein
MSQTERPTTTGAQVAMIWKIAAMQADAVQRLTSTIARTGSLFSKEFLSNDFYVVMLFMVVMRYLVHLCKQIRLYIMSLRHRKAHGFCWHPYFLYMIFMP